MSYENLSNILSFVEESLLKDQKLIRRLSDYSACVSFQEGDVRELLNVSMNVNEVGSPAWLKVARVRVALPFLFVISIFGPLPFGAILDGLADNRDIALEKHDEGRVAAAGN